MRRRKINKNKPMFKKKRSPAKTAIHAALIILLLLVIVFLGYSVGKGITEFVKNRPEKPVESLNPPNLTNDDDSGDEPFIKAPADDDSASVTDVTEPKQDEPVPISDKKRILFVKMPENGGFDDYLNSRITYAQENNYAGICIELLAYGGRICYASKNEKANTAKAVADGGISDLSSAVNKITEAGLVPYARISLLSDHIVSRFDKGVCYLFENSTSTWLDDSAANGGKPWISAFSNGARDYISALAAEISAAGFNGIIAGEAEFPRFRNSDLNYIGPSVKSAERYTALVDFSNAVQQSFGSEKSFAVEIDAHSIIAGKAEILRGITELNAQTICVRYDSEAVGTRIVKADESEVSYVGLSEKDKLCVVMKTVTAALDGSGKTVVPIVSDASLIPALIELGFAEESIVVY